jgi:tellurite resistance-related uncharacterized protein
MEIFKLPNIAYQDFNLNGILSEILPDNYLGKLNNYDITKLNLVKQPNSNNRYCYSLTDELKLSVKKIVDYYYSSFKFYFDNEFKQFETIIGFITINNPQNINGVALHNDDSEYTMNLFLNDNYKGGELICIGKGNINTKFKNIQNKLIDEQEVKIIPEKNKMVIHQGLHKHMVNKVSEGTRYNLILWCYQKKLDDYLLEELKYFIL